MIRMWLSANSIAISDYAQLFATTIARTAKDMDVLIDSLPGEEAAPELQVSDDGLNAPYCSSHHIDFDRFPWRPCADECVFQATNLQQLERENNEAACLLQDVVMRGEALLAQIQDALAEIGGQQLSSKQNESPSKS